MPDYKQLLKEVNAELADMEPRYSILQKIKSGYEDMLRLEANRPNNIELPPDSFAGLKTGDAVLKCLYLVKKRLKPRGVAEIMEAAGYQHNSKDFPNTVNTTLGRLAGESLVTKDNEGWTLTELGALTVEGKMNNGSVSMLTPDSTPGVS